VLEALIMGLVAIATAWGSYQAARWAGVQSMAYSQASAIRVESTRAATRSGQLSLYDTAVFDQWLNARARGEAQLARTYERRFRPEFRPAFDAWLATDPFDNPSAPPGPLSMPQYRLAEQDRADQLEAQASRDFEAGKAANQQSDDYVRNTVILASALFFVAIGQRFDWLPLRFAVLCFALGMLLDGLVHLAMYQVH
jgi:hypothetical protein